MQIMKEFYLTFLLFIFYASGIAQNVGSAMKTEQLLKYAQSAQQMGDYIQQARFLETYLKQKPNDSKVIYLLGIAYLKQKNYLAAEKQLLNTYVNHGKQQCDIAFYLGVCNKSMGRYNQALKYFNECLKSSGNRQLKLNARLNLKGCNLALDSIHKFKTVQLTHLGNEINSKHLDINPVWLNEDSFFYVTLQSDSTYSYTLDGSKTMPQKIFKMARWQGKGWTIDAGEFISDTLSVYDVSGGAFSPDQMRFYFTVSTKNWKNQTINAIYYTEKLNGQWQAPVLLPPEINLQAYSNVHVNIGATYNPDMEAVYFSSNRPNGVGGMDIWYTIYNKKTKLFIPPRNCGTKINSTADEVTPYYNAEIKTLFFSANRADGYGGFDVYKAIGSLNDWVPAVLLEQPLNTNADEIYYAPNANLISGLLVSNRLGALSFAHAYCCYDIYSFQYKELDLPTIQGKIVLNINETLKKYLNQGIKIRTKDSAAVYRDYFNETQAKLYLIPKTEGSALLVETRNLSDTGTYTFKVNRQYDYKIDIEHGTELISSVEVNANSLSEQMLITPTTAPVSIIPKTPIEIENIYYDLNKSDLSDGAKRQLQKTLIPLMNDLDEIKIEILSHTDSIGSEDYNLNLSEQRADIVRRYLISEGISGRRLKSRGLGEDLFIAPNSLPNGADNPEGRRMNRRTEFVILDE
jgi:outer membrane protein OmpA-like peptidoglycan-associated protein